MVWSAIPTLDPGARSGEVKVAVISILFVCSLATCCTQTNPVLIDPERIPVMTRVRLRFVLASASACLILMAVLVDGPRPAGAGGQCRAEFLVGRQ